MPYAFLMRDMCSDIFHCGSPPPIVVGERQVLHGERNRGRSVVAATSSGDNRLLDNDVRRAAGDVSVYSVYSSVTPRTANIWCRRTEPVMGKKSGSQRRGNNRRGDNGLTPPSGHWRRQRGIESLHRHIWGGLFTGCSGLQH